MKSITVVDSCWTSNPRIVIDGIGINLNTMLLKHISEKNPNAVIFESDSSMFASNDFLPHYNSFEVRATCRLSQMYASRNDNHITYFDRGVINHIAWSRVMGSDIFNDSATEYANLEKVLTSGSILMVNKDREFIQRVLNEEEVGSPRVEMFKDVDTYLEMQDKYVSEYAKLAGEHLKLMLVYDESKTIESFIQEYANELHKIFL